MKLGAFLLSLFPALFLAAASAVPSPLSSEIGKRADSSLVGYLGIFFLGDKPNIYFYLSNGNSAFAFNKLNKGNPILVPKLGTGGVRDPSIVSGAGEEKGKKWYIIGTDLDIGKVSIVRWIGCIQ